MASVHLAFREATTGYASVLLKVLKDTGWERENGQLEKLQPGVYMGGIHPCTQMEKKKTELQETLKAYNNLLTLY